MESRLKFIPGQQRRFLEEISFKSKLSTEELAKIVTIHPRSFRDWKREKLTISYKAAKILCIKFNHNLSEGKETLIKRWETSRKEASRIGGLALFKKHGNPATEEGRIKGGIKSIANLRRNGIIPSVKQYNVPKDFNENLAEFVGIMLGDGGITASQCTITLNSIADVVYIGFVSNLSFRLFGEAPKMFKKKNCNAITLYYNGGMLIRYLCSIGLRVGNKVKQQVSVPRWIQDSVTYKKACLRGLMDTDGGVFIHKYKVNGKEYKYKKICFSNRSIPLLLFVSKVLLQLGFTPKIIDKVENKKVWLYNENEVKRYLEVVGSDNFRLSRYKEGDSDGYETSLLNLQGE